MANGATAAWLPTLALRYSAFFSWVECRGACAPLGRIIMRYTEHRERVQLRHVTMQALAHVLEAKGIVFFPGPLRAANCRGTTPHPNIRDDYHLIELSDQRTFHS